MKKLKLLRNISNKVPGTLLQIDISGKRQFPDAGLIWYSDLAGLCEAKTKVLNQAVKRNIARFPSSFMFQLTDVKTEALRSQFVTSKKEVVEDADLMFFQSMMF